MPIDLSAVNWLYVAILSGIAFVATLLGSLISFRNKFYAAIIAAILFGAAFVFWTYYPHDNLAGGAQFVADQPKIECDEAVSYRVDLSAGPVMRNSSQPGEMERS